MVVLSFLQVYIRVYKGTWSLVLTTEDNVGVPTLKRVWVESSVGLDLQTPCPRLLTQDGGVSQDLLRSDEFGGSWYS